MIALPADHVVHGTAAIAKAVRTAITAAATTSSLVTVGLKPTFPSTALGYIHAPGRPIRPPMTSTPLGTRRGVDDVVDVVITRPVCGGTSSVAGSQAGAPHCPRGARAAPRPLHEPTRAGRGVVVLQPDGGGLLRHRITGDSGPLPRRWLQRRGWAFSRPPSQGKPALHSQAHHLSVCRRLP